MSTLSQMEDASIDLTISRYNVRNFVYVRRRPFHPRRLFDLLHDKFILQHEQDDGYASGEGGDDSEATDEGTSDSGHADDGSDAAMTEAPELPDNATILANKRAHPLFSRLFRSKGEIWLATRPNRAGEWSQAGAMLTLKGGRPWFCTIERSEWETGDAEIDGMVEFDVQKGGETGDRRQEVVFIGEDLDMARIERVLDACLLSEEEWEACRGVMSEGVDAQSGKGIVNEEAEDALVDMFDDGFPDWPEEDHTGHDHD